MPPARPASAPPGAPPRSTRHCLSPRRRAAAPPAPAPLPARAPMRIVRARGSWRLDRLLRFRALLERMRRLGRHVVLVVLGEHLARGEHAVGAKLALRHHALALAEKIRQLAAVD